MWLTEWCGGRRRAVATPNRESRKEKEEEAVVASTLHLNYRSTSVVVVVLSFLDSGTFKLHV